MAQQVVQPVSQALEGLQADFVTLIQSYNRLTPQAAAISALKAALRFCQHFRAGEGPEVLLDAEPILESCAPLSAAAAVAGEGCTDPACAALQPNTLQAWAVQHSKDAYLADAWAALDILTLGALCAECTPVFDSGLLALSQLQLEGVYYHALPLADVEELSSIWMRVTQTRPASATTVATFVLDHMEADSSLLSAPGGVRLGAPASSSQC